MKYNNEEIILEITDTSGMESYSGMRESQIEGRDGILMVYAINSRESLMALQSFREEIERSGVDVPIVIVGNKSKGISFDVINIFHLPL